MYKQSTRRVAKVRAQTLGLIGCIEKLYFTDLRRCGQKAYQPGSPNRAALRKHDSTSLFCIPAKKYPTRNCNISLTESTNGSNSARARQTIIFYTPKMAPNIVEPLSLFTGPFSATLWPRAARAKGPGQGKVGYQPTRLYLLHKSF